MRLFVAIELDDDVRRLLVEAQRRLARSCEGVRWTPAEQLHVTMKFLGDVRDREVDAVASALRQSVAPLPPFTMALGGAGCFPGGGPVRIVWAGAVDESGTLLRCAEAVERALEPLGFPPEGRPFSGHVTIGRVKEDRSRGELRRAVTAFEIEPLDQSVAAITLMQSVLSPQGARYTPVARLPLGG